MTKSPMDEDVDRESSPNPLSYFLIFYSEIDEHRIGEAVSSVEDGTGSRHSRPNSEEIVQMLHYNPSHCKDEQKARLAAGEAPTHTHLEVEDGYGKSISDERE